MNINADLYTRPPLFFDFVTPTWNCWVVILIRHFVINRFWNLWTIWWLLLLHFFKWSHPLSPFMKLFGVLTKQKNWILMTVYCRYYYTVLKIAPSQNCSTFCLISRIIKINLISGRIVMISFANSISTMCFSHRTRLPAERFCIYPSTSPRSPAITISRSRCYSLWNCAFIVFVVEVISCRWRLQCMKRFTRNTVSGPQ